MSKHRLTTNNLGFASGTVYFEKSGALVRSVNVRQPCEDPTVIVDVGHRIEVGDLWWASDE